VLSVGPCPILARFALSEACCIASQAFPLCTSRSSFTMVRVTEGLGGNAVEVHDLSGVNPPQVVEFGSIDMNQGMWGMGDYFSQHGESALGTQPYNKATMMQSPAFATGAEQGKQPDGQLPNWGASMDKPTLKFNLNIPDHSMPASTEPTLDSLQAELNAAAAELSLSNNLHQHQVAFGTHELPPPLDMGASSNQPVMVMLDPSLLQAYVPAYHYTPTYEAPNSFASSELSLELMRERQCLEQEMQKLSTQRSARLRVLESDTQSEMTVNTISTTNTQTTANSDASFRSAKSSDSGRSSRSSGGRRRVSKSGACRVDGCEMKLSDMSKYARRHRICEVHLKSLDVMWKGKRQRFCQKCTRFQELSQFDGARHSCRKGLTLQRNRRVDSKKAEAAEVAEAKVKIEKRPRKSRVNSAAIALAVTAEMSVQTDDEE